MIYLDNSATSYPKPQCIMENIEEIIKKYGANSGRGSYKMAIDTSEQIYLSRKNVADFFHASAPEKVIFTYNCTTALNMAIKGIAKKNSHFIISNFEHNAVVRPLEALKQKGICNYSIAKVSNDLYKTLRNFENCINENTVAIICTGASNVFGIIPPYKALAALAHKHNLLFILDYSQLAGVIPLDLRNKNIDIICCSGHKGLYGLSGVGLLIINNDLLLDTIIEGGTGSNSESLLQPDDLPDRFESGTQNIVSIIALSKAIDFIKKTKIENIYNHEIKLLKYLQYHLENNKKIKLYTDLLDNKRKYAPILSFNVKNVHSEEVAEYLSENEIAVRAGLHCAPLAHKTINTISTGTVRISPSINTEKNHIDFLINSLRKFAK